MDRDGRVRTSHAWFASYAPTNNPEIVTIVFIYGGKQGAGVAVQGSEVAVPVNNKILRHYFGLDDDETTPLETETEIDETGQTELVFNGRLLGTDSWSRKGANLNGFVLDSEGQGLGNVTIEIAADGEIIAQAVSAPNGQFDFEVLDPGQAEMWQLRLPDYAATPLLRLEIAEGLRYLLEFKAQPETEDLENENVVGAVDN